KCGGAIRVLSSAAERENDAGCGAGIGDPGDVAGFGESSRLHERIAFAAAEIFKESRNDRGAGTYGDDFGAAGFVGFGVSAGMGIWAGRRGMQAALRREFTGLLAGSSRRRRGGIRRCWHRGSGY